MIVGTGIDIVDVQRIEKHFVRNGAMFEKVFSPEEISYCDGCAKPYEHYAARFAAKEAFLKATGLGLTAGFDLCDIVISSDEVGKPQVTLRGNFREMALKQSWKIIHVSLSHITNVAVASVTIET
ncbi:MAG TPA: holo-ACP synthase [Chryseosolibacter sp.]|nr:holo-ACP synthase [Chryseosolibacter sp.]